jgi:copper chaperone CopZ
MKQGIILLLLTALLAACNTKTSNKQGHEAVEADTVRLVLHVERMTCEHCEMTVEGSVKALAGVFEANASHVDSSTTIRFNSAEVSLAEITEAIESKGYKVVGEK